MKKLVIVGAGAFFVGAVLLLPAGGGMVSSTNSAKAVGMNVALSQLSSDPPGSPLHLLFIHHSVGGSWMADAGNKDAVSREIWRSHPEGGGLRSQLEQQGYVVHEASYGSALGDATDRADWLPKFSGQMERVLTCDQNDRPLAGGLRNRIVMFKSCFPENMLEDEAALARAKATLTALLPEFAKHPDVLFVHVTSPPLTPHLPRERLWRSVARALMGQPQPMDSLRRSGPLARQLANWVTSPDGWLKGYSHQNVAVFDLFDTLTDHGKSDFLAYPTGGGLDSHPSREGNQKATAEFVPFLNRAVRRAGLVAQ